MAFTHTIDESGRRVTVTGTGRVDAADCLREIDRVLDAPDFQAGYSITADLRSVDFYPGSTEIEEFVRKLVSYSDVLEGTIDVLVSSRLLLFAARLACLMAGRRGLHMTARLEPVETGQAVA